MPPPPLMCCVMPPCTMNVAGGGAHGGPRHDFGGITLQMPKGAASFEIFSTIAGCASNCATGQLRYWATTRHRKPCATKA